MLLMIFLGSVVAAVAVVAYSYQVLLGGWGRGSKRVMYAPPPMPPPPPNVSAMLAAVSLPSAPRTLPTGSGQQPTVTAALGAYLAKPAAAPPRRQARGSMPPPVPARASREHATVIVSDEMVNDSTAVEITPLHS